jgi:hypothetical protein
MQAQRFMLTPAMHLRLRFPAPPDFIFKAKHEIALTTCHSNYPVSPFFLPHTRHRKAIRTAHTVDGEPRIPTDALLTYQR